MLVVSGRKWSLEEVNHSRTAHGSRMASFLSFPRARWKTEEEQHQLLYLGFSIHQEVASDSFCFLINSSWLLVFILFLFLHALGLNLYWWKGIHFS